MNEHRERARRIAKRIQPLIPLRPAFPTALEIANATVNNCDDDAKEWPATVRMLLGVRRDFWGWDLPADLEPLVKAICEALEET